MSDSVLLQDFLREEATPDVRAILSKAASAVVSGVPPGRRVFNFNRFDVTLDAETRVAVIEDVMDASPAGKLVMSLTMFIDELSR